MISFFGITLETGRDRRFDLRSPRLLVSLRACPKPDGEDEDDMAAWMRSRRAASVGRPLVLVVAPQRWLILRCYWVGRFVALGFELKHMLRFA